MNNQILHITWKNNELPEKYEFIINQWKITNPQLEIKFYSDEDNDRFIEDYFPELKEVLNRFDKKIMKLDLIRLLYLYQFGGIYSDIDVLPLKNISNLLNLNDTVICEEDRRNAINFGVNYILSNAVIISKPKSDFIKHLIDSIVIMSNKIPSEIDNTIVLNFTGPLFLNDQHRLYPHKDTVTILDSNYFNPMNLDDLIEEKIPKNIEFSFLVHLYDGSWWQSEWNSPKKLMEKIIDDHYKLINPQSEWDTMNDGSYLPKISCLCVTKNTYNYISRSIECFLNNIYPNKELIVVYESNNECISKIKTNYNYDNIKYIEVNVDPKKTLGELRNISIEESTGVYICQWDDDDFHNPLRLWEQYRNCKINNKGGSILNRWVIYDGYNDKFLTRERTDLLGWEGTLLYKKNEIKELYPTISQGEDTEFIKKIEHNISVLDKPELYIYCVHSKNTWDYWSIFYKITKLAEEYKEEFNFKFQKILINE
jgi:mannosyltransferase OCH1-like enzyme